MARPYRVAATGGTFDQIHSGHLALLSKAFQSADFVIIGLSSDEFAFTRGKKLANNFDVRKNNLDAAIKKKFGAVKYSIAKLESEFGPVVLTGDVDALVTSSETATKIKKLNEIRIRNGLSPVNLIVIDLVRAQDGLPISSTRIRSGDIDNEGHVVNRKQKVD